MEAKDLMINDWVSVSGTPMRIAALGTVRAGFLDGNGEMFFHGYDSIKPIPLTAEILEKNKYDYNDSLCEWATDSFCIEFGHVLSNEGQPDHFFIWVSNCEVELNYVHELQHAIRLCGIKKEVMI